MTDFLPFVVSGLATGAVYGLAATGLVLTYKTSGIFNFAHGAVATVAAYAFYFLHVEHGLGWLPAMLIAVLLGPAMGLLFASGAARLGTRSTSYKIVGTIGVVLLVQSVATIAYGPTTIRVAAYFPRARDTVEVAGVFISFNQMFTAGISVLAVIALYVFFRYSRLGVQMRAVVDDADLLAKHGTNPAAIRRLAWIIGTTFAALSGVLLVPFVGLDAILLTFLVVQTFGAAAIGAFSNIPMTFAGGLLIGVVSDLSKKYVLNVTWLSGLPDALPFLILFVVLLLLPRRRLLPPTEVESRRPQRFRTPGRLRLAFGAVGLMPLLLVPVLVGTKLPFFTAGLCSAIVILSLGLLVRTSGQVSLCHATFAAIGAVAFSQFHLEHGLPWLPALLLAGLVVVPVGAIVAVPAIRLAGLFLALATLGFGILVQRLAYGQTWMFGQLVEGRAMPRPGFAATPRAFYYVVLAALVVTSVVVTLVQQARLGRLLRGISGSTTGVASLGLSVNISKVLVFCLSAYFAGIGGALLGVSRGYAVGADPFYSPFFSLALLAMLAIAPFDEPWYALIPGLAAVLPGYLTGAHSSDWLNVVFGVSAIAIAVQGGQPPMPRAVRTWLQRLGSAGATPPTALVPRLAPPLVGLEVARPRGGLEVADLRVRFGGLVAVAGVSFVAPTGHITGLIGPNGAGKTSTFDACSGLNRTYDGSVRLHGSDLASLSPAGRARRGLGRSFQRMELCDPLTTFENVMLGREATQAGRHVRRHLAASPAAWAETQSAAWDALELCAMTHVADEPVGALSTGQRRLVELARCVAGGFDVLLLDEPSSGLDPAETHRLGELLQRLAMERGVGVLLVEHDMGLVMRVCEHVYVLDFGQLIFDGTPAEVATSDIVQAAYLGSPVTDAGRAVTSA